MPKNNHKRNSSVLYWSAETWAFLSLRLFLSLRFLTAGIGKFDGADGYGFSNLYGGFVAKQMEGFAATRLPSFLYGPYLHALAYVEIILGLALLLGVRSKYTLALTSLTFVSLAYGHMLRGNLEGVNSLAIHLMTAMAALYFVRHNKCELLR